MLECLKTVQSINQYLSEDEILGLVWVDGSLCWLQSHCVCAVVCAANRRGGFLPAGCGTLTERHRLEVIKAAACRGSPEQQPG